MDGWMCILEVKLRLFWIASRSRIAWSCLALASFSRFCASSSSSFRAAWWKSQAQHFGFWKTASYFKTGDENEGETSCITVVEFIAQLLDFVQQIHAVVLQSTRCLSEVLVLYILKIFAQNTKDKQHRMYILLKGNVSTYFAIEGLSVSRKGHNHILLCRWWHKSLS